MRKALLSPWRNDGGKSYGQEAIPLHLTHKFKPNHASWKTLLPPWEKARENIYHKMQTRAYLHAQSEITRNLWKTILSLSQKERKKVPLLPQATLTTYHTAPEPTISHYIPFSSLTLILGCFNRIL